MCLQLFLSREENAKKERKDLGQTYEIHVANNNYLMPWCLQISKKITFFTKGMANLIINSLIINKINYSF